MCNAFLLIGNPIPEYPQNQAYSRPGEISLKALQNADGPNRLSTRRIRAALQVIKQQIREKQHHHP